MPALCWRVSRAQQTLHFSCFMAPVQRMLKARGVEAGGKIPTGKRTQVRATRLGGRKSTQLRDRGSDSRGGKKTDPRADQPRPTEQRSAKLSWVDPSGPHCQTGQEGGRRDGARGADQEVEPAPPQPKDTIVRKWREWILLQQLLKDLRAAGAAELLSHHVARGHFVSKHDDFHQNPKCQACPGHLWLGLYMVDLRHVC